MGKKPPWIPSKKPRAAHVSELHKAALYDQIPDEEIKTALENGALSVLVFPGAPASDD